jgi:hypothetical protein
MKCEQDIWFDVVHIEAVVGYFKEMASMYFVVLQNEADFTL